MPERLVGIPYIHEGRDERGADCWGIVHLGLKRLGIHVPDYLEMTYTPKDLNQQAQALAAGAERNWRQVEPAETRRGDVVLLSLGGIAGHCGLVLRRGMMLHSTSGMTSRLERYTGPAYARRIAGFYRFCG